MNCNGRCQASHITDLFVHWVLVCLPFVGNLCEHVVTRKCLGVSGGMHAVRFQHSGAGDTGPNYTGSKTSPSSSGGTSLLKATLKSPPVDS